MEQWVRQMDADMREIGRMRPDRLSVHLHLKQSASASMQLMEPPWAEPGNLFDIRAENRSCGVFRIHSMEIRYEHGKSQTLELEHVSAALHDRVLFGHHEVHDMPVREVMHFLLGFQDLWQLGMCEAEETVSLSFENVDIRSGMQKLLEVLSSEYFFRYETPAMKVHVLRLEAEPSCEIRLSRNARNVRIREDVSAVVTRLYALGYGEGADQLKLPEKYLEADTQNVYGIREQILADRTVDLPEQLQALAEREISAKSRPSTSLAAELDLLHGMTGEDLDRFEPGRLCRLCLPEEGKVICLHVMSLEIPDAYGHMARLNLDSTGTAGQMLSGLARHLETESVTSQGSASEYGVHFGDNADADHPAELSFYVDEDAIRVNKVMVRWKVLPFRAYTQQKSGGGTGSLVMDGVSATVQVPAQNLQTGYQIGAAAEGKHYHTAQTVNQSLTVKILSSTLEKALNVGEHVHKTVFGIYSPKSSLDGVRVYVDGNPVPDTGQEMDALPYLDRDSEGRVRRGAWHTISFQPDGLARIEADVHVRTFIRSLTGEGL